MGGREEAKMTSRMTMLHGAVIQEDWAGRTKLWTQPSVQGAGRVGNSAPTPLQPLSSHASWVGIYTLLSAVICLLGVQALHAGVGELTDYVYFLLEKSKNESNDRNRNPHVTGCLDGTFGVFGFSCDSRR